MQATGSLGLTHRIPKEVGTDHCTVEIRETFTCAGVKVQSEEQRQVSYSVYGTQQIWWMGKQGDAFNCMSAHVFPERCSDEAVRPQPSSSLLPALGSCPQPGWPGIGRLEAALPSSASAAFLSLVCRLVLKGKNKRRHEISNSA